MFFPETLTAIPKITLIFSGNIERFFTARPKENITRVSNLESAATLTADPIAIPKSFVLKTQGTVGYLFLFFTILHATIITIH